MTQFDCGPAARGAGNLRNLSLVAAAAAVFFCLSWGGFAQGAPAIGTTAAAGGGSAPIALAAPPIANDVHPSVPGFSSDAGAPYTIYLDFGGFNFSGNWGNNASYTPGTNSAYDNASGAFNAQELANIKETWSRIAQIYAPFNVNVTTVDPAVAAGQAATDLQRQNYYDAQARMMHTVIGGNGSWLAGAGGVSYVGVTPSAFPGSNGYHTNFLFANQAPSFLTFISTGAAHEDGHGFGLDHQSDYSGSSLVNEYNGGYTTPGGGTVAPIMGVAYYTNRGLFALGTADAGTRITQNDPHVIVNDNGMGGYKNDAVGHSTATATPLPRTGSTINYAQASGVIVPLSAESPNPIGPSNYSQDVWSFHTTGGSVSITSNSGISTITPGSPDPGATLDTTLEILDSNGDALYTSNTTNLSESLNVNLPAGNYFAEVLPSAELTDSSSNNREFYDMGSFFLTGNVPLPEPTAAGLLLLAAAGLLRRRRRSASIWRCDGRSLGSEPASLT